MREEVNQGAIERLSNKKKGWVPKSKVLGEKNLEKEKSWYVVISSERNRLHFWESPRAIVGKEVWEGGTLTHEIRKDDINAASVETGRRYFIGQRKP